MPYVTMEARSRVDPGSSARMAGQRAAGPGELSYLISQVIAGYLAPKGSSFTVYAGVVGTLVLMVFELWKRFVEDYEDRKYTENGGVW